MKLPLPIKNSLPVFYLVLGFVAWYFAIEEIIQVVVFDRGMGLAVFLSITSLVLISYGFHIERIKTYKQKN